MRHTYLITGASGFIGSVLARRLVRHHEKVHVILHKKSHPWRLRTILHKMNIHISDLSSESGLRSIIQDAKPDIIYHLATNGAYSDQNNPDQIMTTNILGTWNLLKACNAVAYTVFINTGSSSEYGFKRTAMRETDSLEPASYYAVSKCAQTLLCCHFARQEKRPVVTLRPFSVYGPYEEPRRFIPTLMKSLLLETPMQLVSPDTARDQIFVEDVVDAYLCIDTLSLNPGECFNIGTGIQSTIKDVVQTAAHVTGKTTTFHWGSMNNRAWDTNRWVADISKAKKLLNWTPKTPLSEGLTLTWKWFQRYSYLYP